MNEKEIMLSAVNSMGYFVLRDFKLETGEISEGSFVESIKEETWNFLELLNTTLETYENLPEIKEALKYELKEGDYDLGSFLLWLDESFGGTQSLVTNFYCGLIDEIQEEENAPTCKLIYTEALWVLEVDGIGANFLTYDNAVYFAGHYKNLGYEIQYFKEDSEGRRTELLNFEQKRYK